MLTASVLSKFIHIMLCLWLLLDRYLYILQTEIVRIQCWHSKEHNWNYLDFAMCHVSFFLSFSLFSLSIIIYIPLSLSLSLSLSLYLSLFFFLSLSLSLSLSPSLSLSIFQEVMQFKTIAWQCPFLSYILNNFHTVTIDTHLINECMFIVLIGGM